MTFLRDKQIPLHDWNPFYRDVYRNNGDYSSQCQIEIIGPARSKNGFSLASSSNKPLLAEQPFTVEIF